MGLVVPSRVIGRRTFLHYYTVCCPSASVALQPPCNSLRVPSRPISFFATVFSLHERDSPPFHRFPSHLQPFPPPFFSNLLFLLVVVASSFVHGLLYCKIFPTTIPYLFLSNPVTFRYIQLHVSLKKRSLSCFPEISSFHEILHCHKLRWSTAPLPWIFL